MERPLAQRHDGEPSSHRGSSEVRARQGPDQTTTSSRSLSPSSKRRRRRPFQPQHRRSIKTRWRSAYRNKSHYRLARLTAPAVADPEFTCVFSVVGVARSESSPKTIVASSLSSPLPPAVWSGGISATGPSKSCEQRSPIDRRRKRMRPRDRPTTSKSALTAARARPVAASPATTLTRSGTAPN